MNIATAPVNRTGRILLDLINFWFAGLKYSYRKLKGHSQIRKILFYPEINEIGLLADIVNRASWYFPKSEISGLKIYVPVSRNLIDTDPQVLTPPSWEENYIKNSIPVEFTERKDRNLNGFDAIMVWSWKSLMNVRIIPQWHKVYIVDPMFYSYVESETYRSMYKKSVSPDSLETLLHLSKTNYERLLHKVSGLKKGYIFGTGPSVEEAVKHNFSDGFTVVCNSIVKNRNLLKHINPDLLVFADPVFHFSPCRYSAEFRRQMLEAVRELGCFIMIPEINLPMMISHYPELKDFIIGMPALNDSYNFPTRENYFVKQTDNIMTLLMLPVASAFSEEIYILGSDGRMPDDNYFWKHGRTVQFEELMDTAFKTHPSFFKDRDYPGYYTRHCKVLTEMVEYGEKMGKKYYSLTSSRIPALIERPAPKG